MKRKPIIKQEEPKVEVPQEFAYFQKLIDESLSALEKNEDELAKVLTELSSRSLNSDEKEQIMNLVASGAKSSKKIMKVLGKKNGK